MGKQVKGARGSSSRGPEENVKRARDMLKRPGSTLKWPGEHFKGPGAC